MSLLLFYKFSLGISVLSGGVLPLVGHHLIIRGKVLEIFALAQLAFLGNLLFHSFGEVAGLIASGFFLMVGKWLIGLLKVDSSFFRNIMIGLYLFLMAVQYLLVGIFPQWDMALRVGLFGNVVTATFFDNIIMALFFTLFLLLYFYHAKSIARRSLDVGIFRKRGVDRFDSILFLLPLVASLYGLGFLFTLSFILLPGVLLGSDFDNQNKGLKAIILLASFSSFIGLVCSILFERAGATSLQVVILFGLCILVKILKRINARSGR